MNGHDPIDVYLDALLGRLRGDPSTVRRILTEAEAHLRDAVDAGATADEAIARFGDVDMIATQVSPSPPWVRLARELVVVACLLGSLGLGAIGVSGVITGAMDLAAGPRFVAGDLPGVTYDAARCAELKEYTTVGASCLAAAARHHTDEVETYRLAAGVLGMIGLATWWALRRRWRPPTASALPSGLVDAVAATAFAVAGLFLVAQATNGLDARTTDGLGQWASGALVAWVLTVVFAWRTVRHLRARA
jgi:hypothetical protein